MQRHIEEAKSTLEDEPAAGSPDVVTIRLTFPNSAKLQRRFLKTQSLKNMFAFIDSNSTAEPDGGPHKVLPKTYRLIAYHPRREIEYIKGTIGSMTIVIWRRFSSSFTHAESSVIERQRKEKEQNR